MSLLLPRIGLQTVRSNLVSVRTPGLLTCLVRFKSEVPSNYKPKPQLPTAGEWNYLKQHIPGETVQTNTLKDRLPKFPLGKENVPTLLPRPGVPQVGSKFTFTQVLNILQNKTKPELIYESEPHRLYFLTCLACAVVFAVYACVLLEWAFFMARTEYEENEELIVNEQLRKREWAFSVLKYSIPASLMFGFSYFIGLFPTRLVRRMWYLPGPNPHIKFTSYPLLPGKPTPVYTVPLANLTRKHTAKIWTGKGFYGTADKGLFFFVIKETLANKRTKNWIVDRKAFFWSDGRVFDYLFGKETIAVAEAGVPYDEQFGIINRQLKKKKKQLRKEHGVFWKWKMMGEEVGKDVNKAGSYVATLTNKQKGNKKSLPKGNEK
ncbi:hypothetical protein JA1_005102 [Spathaspora sp. JA1]|nr:hypothetical protein JA1_005102 [Spathaspora sp. JA1]